MYKGRVGMDAIPNRYIHDKTIEWHFKIHHHRMDLIKKRKPGTGTVDSSCPSSATEGRAWREASRKIRVKQLEDKIAHQNTTLLQRITKVATTGTDLFDPDYKPVTKSLTSVARKQKTVNLSKRNKHLKHILETTQPYYSVKEWEQKREKEVSALKYMKKVHYEKKSSTQNQANFAKMEGRKLIKEMEDRRKGKNLGNINILKDRDCNNEDDEEQEGDIFKLHSNLASEPTVTSGAGQVEDGEEVNQEGIDNTERKGKGNSNIVKSKLEGAKLQDKKLSQGNPKFSSKPMDPISQVQDMFDSIYIQKNNQENIEDVAEPEKNVIETPNSPRHLLNEQKKNP